MLQLIPHNQSPVRKTNFIMIVNFTLNDFHEMSRLVTCAASTQGNRFLFFLSALNFLLAISASLGNAAVFFALRKISSLQPASKLMYQCLVVTDFCVGVFAQPLFAFQLFSVTSRRLQLCYILVTINNILGKVLSGVSLFILTAISLDRLCALCLRLNYKYVITFRRTLAVIIWIWLLNISLANLRRFWKHALITDLMSAFIFSALTISAMSYLTIFLKLRKYCHEVQGTNQDNQSNVRRSAFNIAKYKRTVFTGLYVQIALVTCYLPFGSTIVLTGTRGYNPSSNVAVRLAITLALLNSSLNPILYCWRLRGVRQGVKQAVRNIVGHPRQLPQ